MRSLLIMGLLVLVGCATPSGPRTIHWDLVDAHPNGTTAPVLSDGELILSGRALRSQNLYAAPVTVQCELQSEQLPSKSSFYIDFVPEGSSLSELPQDYFGIELSADQTTLKVWESRRNQPPHLIKSAGVLVEAGGHYKSTVEVQRGNVIVHVNGGTLTVDQPVPYDRFRIELRTFPPPSSWHVRDFVIH